MRWSVFGALSGAVAVVLGFWGMVFGYSTDSTTVGHWALGILLVGIVVIVVGIVNTDREEYWRARWRSAPPVTSDDVGFLPFHPLEKGLDREAFIKEQMIRRLKQPSPYSGDDKGRRS